MKRPLYDFQTTGLIYLYFAKRCILADATGLGKTIECIGLFQFLEKYTNEDNRWIIIAPPNAVYQWEEEFKKFTDFHPALAVGDRDERILYYISPQWQFLVLSYHMLWRDWTLLNRLKVKNWVFDDAHFFKNHDTKTAELVKTLTLNAKRIILATATPVQKTPMDLHSLLEVLKLTHIFGSRVGFENHFCVIRKTRCTRKDGRSWWQKDFIRVRNKTELSTKVAPYCIKRKPLEVGQQLPDLMVQPMWFDFDKKQQSIYGQIKDSVIKAYDKGQLTEVKNKGFHSMRQVCGGTRTFGLKEDKSPKLDAVEFFLQEKLGRNEKVVIYSFYKETVRTLQDRLVRLRKARKIDFSWVVMSGDDKSQEARETAKQEFIHNSNCRVLIGTDAIKVSMNLQVARFLIMLDWISNPKDVEQLIGRLRRLESKVNKVIVYPFLMRKTIEEGLWRKTRFESTISDGIFKERSDVFKLTDKEFMTLVREY